jgi:hypothetical protein
MRIPTETGALVGVRSHLASLAVPEAPFSASSFCAFTSGTAGRLLLVKATLLWSYRSWTSLPDDESL